MIRQTKWPTHWLIWWYLQKPMYYVFKACGMRMAPTLSYLPIPCWPSHCMRWDIIWLCYRGRNRTAAGPSSDNVLGSGQETTGKRLCKAAEIEDWAEEDVDKECSCLKTEEVLRSSWCGKTPIAGWGTTGNVSWELVCILWIETDDSEESLGMMLKKRTYCWHRG